MCVGLLAGGLQSLLPAEVVQPPVGGQARREDGVLGLVRGHLAVGGLKIK